MADVGAEVLRIIKDDPGTLSMEEIASKLPDNLRLLARNMVQYANDTEYPSFQESYARALELLKARWIKSGGLKNQRTGKDGCMLQTPADSRFAQFVLSANYGMSEKSEVKVEQGLDGDTIDAIIKRIEAEERKRRATPQAVAVVSAPKLLPDAPQ